MQSYAVTFTDGRVAELNGPLTITSRYYRFGSDKYERTTVALIEDLNPETDESGDEDEQDDEQ